MTKMRERESSTLFAVSQYFNVPSAALLYIADNIIKKETLFGEEFEKTKEKLNDSKFETYKVAFEELFS